MEYLCRRPYRSFATFAIASMLTGCASFSGAPRPVIPLDGIVDLAQSDDFRLEAAAKRVAAGTATRDYRDAFVAVHLAAIDARYYEFRGKLSAQSKSANLGLELGVLALTGAGSVVTTPLANILSAGGAGLTGTKAAVSKEVYFERALPAIMASIEARRIAARTPIVVGLGRDIDRYPLVQAISDLYAYQNSASIDGAIGQITASAARDVAKAEEQYTDVTPACSRPEKNVGADWDDFASGIDALKPGVAADDQTLVTIGKMVGAGAVARAVPTVDAIVDTVEGSYCTRTEMKALMNRIATTTGVTFP